MKQTDTYPIMIGITGPSGSGKSLLRLFLERSDFPCIDADEVYHGMLIPPSPCLDALRLAFGDRIFREDGTLDRQKLGEIVFHDPDQLALLNQTVLSRVLDNIRAEVARYGRESKKLVFVDAPTLIESGLHKECRKVITVVAPPELRARRIAERDHISAEQAQTRIRAQKDDAFYISHADYVLQNDTDESRFLSQAKHMLSELTSTLFPTS